MEESGPSICATTQMVERRKGYRRQTLCRSWERTLKIGPLAPTQSCFRTLKALAANHAMAVKRLPEPTEKHSSFGAEAISDQVLRAFDCTKLMPVSGAGRSPGVSAM